MSKVLIAYFSRRDENYVGYSKRYLEKGNTEIAVEKIASFISADVFPIIMKNPYSKEYDACMEESKRDYNQDARPEMLNAPESIDMYDTVILAYPNYWNTMPMVCFTFLESFDFSGKTILPLCTNEGSDLGKSEEAIRMLCPGAKLGTGLSLCGSGINSADPHIERWLRENGVLA